MENTNSLESRIQRLEDVEAIKKLQASYGHGVDTGWNGKVFNDVSAYFAQDATFDCDAFNLHAKGNKEISTVLESGATFKIAQHSFTNPIIDVDGDKATGKWLLWVGVNDGTKATIVFESEDIEYVRTPDGWLFQSIKLYIAQMLNS